MNEVFLPRSLEELWSVWGENPAAHIYAGGTDLLVKLRAGLLPPAALICLERLPELVGVESLGDTVRIGAGVTHSTLLAHPIICRYFPVLARALAELGSPPIRNMATIGGNICTASPAGDTLPPLYVLGAELELQSRNGGRTLSLDAFIEGPGQTRLASEEILTAIRIKKPVEFNRHHFDKVGQRKALAIAVVSLAALLRVSAAGVVDQARFAWGSVGPTIVTCPEVEQMLTGRELRPALLQEAADAAMHAVSPIDDVRATAAYRRQVAGNLLLRLAAPCLRQA
jgi:CO/xanthine dehydrogenase FAD-binding subunit